MSAYTQRSSGHNIARHGRFWVYWILGWYPAGATRPPQTTPVLSNKGLHQASLQTPLQQSSPCVQSPRDTVLPGSQPATWTRKQTADVKCPKCIECDMWAVPLAVPPSVSNTHHQQPPPSKLHRKQPPLQPPNQLVATPTVWALTLTPILSSFPLLSLSSPLTFAKVTLSAAAVLVVVTPFPGRELEVRTTWEHNRQHQTGPSLLFLAARTN